MAAGPSGKPPNSTEAFLRQLRGGPPQRTKEETEQFDGIWEIVGVAPRHFCLQRFGSNSDVATFHLLRCIAIVDSVWVPLGLSFMALPGQSLAQNFAVRATEIALGLLYAYGVLMRLLTSTVDLPTGREYVELGDILFIQSKRPSFWLDVLSLPGSFWWCPFVDLQWQPILGLRLLRLWRLPSMAGEVYDTATGAGERSTMFTVAELLGSIWLMCHIFACAWFASLTWTEVDLADFQAQNRDLSEMNLVTVYFQCLRDGAGMLVGWGQPSQSVNTNDPDAITGLMSHAASMVWVLAGPIGSMYMAVVFALLMIAIDRAGRQQALHMERMGKTRAVLDSLRVPKGLKERVLRYHAFLSVHNVDKTTYEVVFQGLSTSLNVEIKLVMFETLVMNAPFFEDVPAAVIMHMVQAFEEEVFSPGEMVVCKGETGREMFFIIKGFCEVMPDDDALLVVCVRSLGDYFGEVALVVENQPRTAWIRARTFCVLARLTRKSLDSCLHGYPGIKQRMLSKIGGYNLSLQSPPDEMQMREDTPLLLGQELTTSGPGALRPLSERIAGRTNGGTGGTSELKEMREKIDEVHDDLRLLREDMRRIAGSLGHGLSTG